MFLLVAAVSEASLSVPTVGASAGAQAERLAVTVSLGVTVVPAVGAADVVTEPALAVLVSLRTHSEASTAVEAASEGATAIPDTALNIFLAVTSGFGDFGVLGRFGWGREGESQEGQGGCEYELLKRNNRCG